LHERSRDRNMALYGIATEASQYGFNLYENVAVANCWDEDWFYNRRD
jgi:hypothetical protein